MDPEGFWFLAAFVVSLAVLCVIMAFHLMERELSEVNRQLYQLRAATIKSHTNIDPSDERYATE